MHTCLMLPAGDAPPPPPPRPQAVQDYVVFTYDDYRSGLNGPVTLLFGKTARVRAVREARYKLAEYWDPLGRAASEWELYDLQVSGGGD